MIFITFALTIILAHQLVEISCGFQQLPICVIRQPALSNSIIASKNINSQDANLVIEDLQKMIKAWGYWSLCITAPIWVIHRHITKRLGFELRPTVSVGIVAIIVVGLVLSDSVEKAAFSIEKGLEKTGDSIANSIDNGLEKAGDSIGSGINSGIRCGSNSLGGSMERSFIYLGVALIAAAFIVKDK